MVKVVCAIDDASLPDADMDVLVLPEAVELDSLVSASDKYARTLVVGAAREGLYMRGFALYRGVNLIDYLKIGTDGRSKGTSRPPNRAVCELPSLALGILICMDVEHEYRLEVRDALLESDKPTKLLCVPADMAHFWFSTQPVLGF